MKQSTTTTTTAALLAMTIILAGKTTKAGTATQVGTSRIAGYQTKSTVTGSPIDLDQAEMERHLNAGDFQKAKQIYVDGAHLGPYATLTLKEPILADYTLEQQNSNAIIGMTENGQDAVYATLNNQKLFKGQSHLSISYHVTEDQYHSKQIPCAVGGRDEPNLDGCLASSGGLILEGYGAINYVYDPLQDNRFSGSLYGFSEHEAEKMFRCKDKCPYPEYEKFYKYYGQMDYGDLWIKAALEGVETGFTNGAHLTHGSEDFGYLGIAGRAEAVKTATVTMNVFTQVNRIMTEWSVEKCHKECGNERPCPEAAQPWDTAVATYAGSLEGADGTGNGYLLYSLADRLCTDFATCGEKKNDVTGTAGVNIDIVREFQYGRSHLEAGSCYSAKHVKDKVNQLMTVPLIQATLRSAYRLQYQLTHDKTDDEERGRAAGYVAALLPDVYACNHMDASIIYENLRVSNAGSPNFADVKEALERNYECMAIQCNDVGGLYDPETGSYHKNAEPCGHRRTSAASSSSRVNDTSSETKGMVAFILCNMIVLAALVVKRTRWVPAISSQIDSIWESSRSTPTDSSTRYTLTARDGNLYEPMAPNNETLADYSERSHSDFSLSERSHSIEDYNEHSSSVIEYA